MRTVWCVSLTVARWHARSENDARADVTREQWQLLLSNVRAASLPSALVGVMYAAFFVQAAAAPHAVGWCLALAVVLSMRHAVARPSADGLGLLFGPAWLLFLLLFATGLLWGLAPMLVIHHTDDMLLFTAVLLASGMAMSAFGRFRRSLRFSPITKSRWTFRSRHLRPPLFRRRRSAKA